MRGQVTVSLTWMFALIAGIAIFSLIINFALQEQESIETVESNTVMQHITTQLRTARSAPNTFTEIEIPDASLTFECRGPTQWETSAIRMEDAETVENTRYTPIFAPETLEGGMLHAWSRQLHLPYPVTDMLYIANPDTIFIIDNRSADLATIDKVNSFMQDFPDRFTTNVTQTGNLEPRPGFAHTRYVLFGGNTDVQGTIINITTDDFTNGTVRFGGNDAAFAGKEMAYGAVFSGDLLTYSCNKEKAMNRLRNISWVNANRSRRLKQNLTAEATCTPLPDCNDCISVLGEVNATYNTLKTLQVPLPAHTAAANASHLEELTTQLERGSCPEI